MKRLLSLGAAIMLTLSFVAPTLAYHGSLGLQIRLARLDPLVCGTNIRIAVDVVNSQGEAMQGIEVKVKLRPHRMADRVGPNLATPYTEWTITDSEGRANSTEGIGRPFVKLVCKSDARTLSATIFSHNGERVLVKSTLDLRCNFKNNCIN